MAIALGFEAAGVSKEKLSHREVLEVGKKAAADFAALLNVAFKAARETN